MKKLILLALAVMMMTGCDYVASSYTTAEGIRVSVIDSCEYLHYSNGYGPLYTHKGNCKYCKERRAAEVRRMLEEFGK